MIFDITVTELLNYVPQWVRDRADFSHLLVKAEYDTLAYLRSQNYNVAVSLYLGDALTGELVYTDAVVLALVLSIADVATQYAREAEYDERRGVVSEKVGERSITYDKQYKTADMSALMWRLNSYRARLSLTEPLYYL